MIMTETLRADLAEQGAPLHHPDAQGAFATVTGERVETDVYMRRTIGIPID